MRMETRDEVDRLRALVEENDRTLLDLVMGLAHGMGEIRRRLGMPEGGDEDVVLRVEHRDSFLGEPAV